MILLLDNYDSFVHNLARYFRQLGCPTEVIRSDQFDVATYESLAPDAVVISPGPRRPADAGCSVDVIKQLWMGDHPKTSSGLELDDRLR